MADASWNKLEKVIPKKIGHKSLKVTLSMGLLLKYLMHLITIPRHIYLSIFSEIAKESK